MNNNNEILRLLQVFTVIEALADGAVKQGVPRQMALQFAAQTVLGAAKTVLQTEKHPAVLRDEVSKNELVDSLKITKILHLRCVRQVDPPSLVCMSSKK